MSNQRTIILLTDDPAWNKPLLRFLTAGGVSVILVTHYAEAPAEGLLFNRMSARYAGCDLARARQIEAFLADQEANGRRVINGSMCFRLGYDKLEQHRVFEACDVQTPSTAQVSPGQRALPEHEVLLKPRCGSYGNDIKRLAPGLAIPQSIAEQVPGYIEQQAITPIDHAVHRVEMIGQRILYGAETPIIPGNYNYCLAGEKSKSQLTAEIDPEIAAQVARLSARSGLQVGSFEYLMASSGTPYFIDINPVSSFHPAAATAIGCDPNQLLAEWLIDQLVRIH